MRKCKRCGEEKPDEAFRPGGYGPRSKCRKCETAQYEERRKLRKGKVPAPEITAPLPPTTDAYFKTEWPKVAPPDLFEFVPETKPVISERRLHCDLPGYSARMFDVTYEEPPAARLQRVLLIPDVHAPYHDEPAFQLMLRAARVLKPDIVVCLGDFADFYAVSAHSKNPERAHDLEYEVGVVKEKLREIEALGARTSVYIAGNHEDRLSRYLCDRAPALFKTVQIPEVLDLRERWHYVPYKDSYKLGKLHLTHDTGTAGRNANRQAMDAFQGSTIIGHTHRMEYSVVGRVDGPPILGAMLGWLGDFERVDYMHRVRSRRDWVHGFGIGFMEPNGIVHVQPVPIVNGSVCILGQVIR